MVKSSFFAKNLLSDYVEGLLPPNREAELKEFLEKTPECRSIHEDLLKTINILHSLPMRRMPQELALKLMEACHGQQPKLTAKFRVRQFLLLLTIPAMLVVSAFILFPDRMGSWLPNRGIASESRFVRYDPLVQGAAEILEEQAAWIQMRDTFTGSLWEEGGLSPEEFEKSFQRVFKSDRL